MAVGLDTSQFTGVLFGWIRSGLIWFIAIAMIIIFLYAIKKIRFKRKFVIPVVEVIDIGGGKMGIYFGKKGKRIGKKLMAGWVNKNSNFFGLIESGPQRLKTTDKRIIHYASSTDFQEINNRAGLVVKRKDDDPNILVPLTRMEISNLDLLTKIAPANYQDAAAANINEAENEMKDKILQYLIPVSIVGFGICLVISMFILQNMFKTGGEQITEMVKTAASQSFQSIQTAKGNPSTAPLLFLIPNLFKRK